MAEQVTPLIMCGGAGTRLWPASREDLPKQFLRLLGPRSTFQDTMLRVADPALFGRPIVITNRQYRFLVAEQLADIDVKADILLEPHRRDSGPAIVAGTVFAQRRNGDDPVIVVLAADHVIADPPAFSAACRTAKRAAEEGRIVTFGIRPDRPATDYGYIQPGDALLGEVRSIERFVEKPTAERAASYMSEGYLWNSGNFLFRTGVFLDEYRAFEAPSVDAAVAAVQGSTPDLGFVVLDPEAFARAKAISVDYAVMEKTRRAAVLPVSYGWSDVGSWETIWQLAAKDQAGNAIGEAAALDSKGCYVFSEKSQVALLGVEDLVVIATDDAILVARRGSVDGMKRLVDHLRNVAPQVTKDHLSVHRPWGSYRSLDNGSRYQVKRIVVKPHGRLSLQMHHHRAEHWIVVRGTALVTVGDQARVVHENESTYIPIGAKHRLENPGKIDLELIEVQSGSYLGEDDIVRFDDDYRRSGSET